MLRSFVAFPVLALVVILQSAVISRISLLSGFGDLMLVVLVAWGLQSGAISPWLWTLLGGFLVGFVTKVPWPAILLGYLLVTLMARLLQRRVWQAPLLAMFSVTFLGTVFVNVLVFISLQIVGNPITFNEAIGLIMLPALLLNLLFSLPVYYMMRDLARWVDPSTEVE